MKASILLLLLQLLLLLIEQNVCHIHLDLPYLLHQYTTDNNNINNIQLSLGHHAGLLLGYLGVQSSSNYYYYYYY